MNDELENKARRNSYRWDYWDYSSAGNYFVTICTAYRQHSFGVIENGVMQLSESGQIVANEIEKLPTYHQRLRLDESVVMPNHIHLLLTLGTEDYNNGISAPTPTPVTEIHEFPLPPESPQQDIKAYRKQRRKMLIPKIIGKLKMQTSKQINLHHKTQGYRNWQPNYHDHVIRDEKSYERIKQYIQNNPAKWEKDKFYNN